MWACTYVFIRIWLLRECFSFADRIQNATTKNAFQIVARASICHDLSAAILLYTHDALAMQAERSANPTYEDYTNVG